jgi:hypothetical protein
MSWYVSSIGKVPAVRAAVAKAFGSTSCSEPEESVRLAAQQVLVAALAAQDDSAVVKVEASGSQTSVTYPTPYVTNYLKITVEPQYGFVE